VQIESVAAEKNKSRTKKLPRKKSEHKHKAKDSVGGEVTENDYQKPSFQPYTPVTKAASNLKRKRDGDSADKDSTALREYLDVMKPPTKSKTWANEESYHPKDSSQGPALGDKTEETRTEVGQGQELDKKGKKHKRSKSSNKAVDTDEPAVPDLTVKSEKEGDREKKKKKKSKNKSKIEPVQNGGKSLDADEDPPEELYADPYQPNVPKSDAEWLRSRTSRLLGLVDDEDISDVDTGDSKTRVLSDGESVDDSSESSTPINTLSQQQAEQENRETDASDEPIDANIDSINASGRLFIRNLPYTATNVDLEEVFSQFGKLEEVCTILV
jgi:multiple RNA-binding domain-containing protein 1